MLMKLESREGGRPAIMKTNPRREIGWPWAILVVAGVVMGGCSGSGNPAPTLLSTKTEHNDAVEETIRIETRELHNLPDESPTMASEKVDAGPAGETQTADVGGTYQIGAGDTLSFRSYDDPTLNEDITVRYDGFISLPLIPDISVLSATREEATERVRAAYEEFFVDPQVSLSIQDVRSKSYYVIGDVTRPAEYPYTRPTSLLEAIYNAGGQRINTRGGDSFVGGAGQLVKAFIIRQVEGERAVIEYDLRGLDQSGSHESEAAVHPGDVVYLPEGVNLVYLLGEVGQASVRQLRPNMTLLQMLAQANGWNSVTGRIRHVVLMREIDEETTEVHSINLRRILKTGQDIVLQAGDVIYVPQRRFVRLQNFVNQFTGTISPLLNLYNLAYNTYYTDQRLRQAFDSNGGFGASSDVTLLQNLLADIQGLAPVFATQ